MNESLNRAVAVAGVLLLFTVSLAIFLVVLCSEIEAEFSPVWRVWSKEYNNREHNRRGGWCSSWSAAARVGVEVEAVVSFMRPAVPAQASKTLQVRGAVRVLVSRKSWGLFLLLLLLTLLFLAVPWTQSW